VALGGRPLPDTQRSGRVLLGVIIALNYRPIAMDAINFDRSGNMFVWSHLLSALLMIVLFIVQAGERKREVRA
jgi:hypothetical protein